MDIGFSMMGLLSPILEDPVNELREEEIDRIEEEKRIYEDDEEDGVFLKEDQHDVESLHVAQNNGDVNHVSINNALEYAETANGCVDVHEMKSETVALAQVVGTHDHDEGKSNITSEISGFHGEQNNKHEDEVTVNFDENIRSNVCKQNTSDGGLDEGATDFDSLSAEAHINEINTTFNQQEEQNQVNKCDIKTTCDGKDLEGNKRLKKANLKLNIVQNNNELIQQNQVGHIQNEMMVEGNYDLSTSKDDLEFTESTKLAETNLDVHIGNHGHCTEEIQEKEDVEQDRDVGQNIETRICEGNENTDVQGISLQSSVSVNYDESIQQITGEVVGNDKNVEDYIHLSQQDHEMNQQEKVTAIERKEQLEGNSDLNDRNDVELSIPSESPAIGKTEHLIQGKDNENDQGMITTGVDKDEKSEKYDIEGSTDVKVSIDERSTSEAAIAIVKESNEVTNRTETNDLVQVGSPVDTKDKDIAAMVSTTEAKHSDPDKVSQKVESKGKDLDKIDSPEKTTGKDLDTVANKIKRKGKDIDSVDKQVESKGKDLDKGDKVNSKLESKGKVDLDEVGSQLETKGKDFDSTCDKNKKNEVKHGDKPSPGTTKSWKKAILVEEKVNTSKQTEKSSSKEKQDSKGVTADREASKQKGTEKVTETKSNKATTEGQTDSPKPPAQQRLTWAQKRQLKQQQEQERIKQEQEKQQQLKSSKQEKQQAQDEAAKKDSKKQPKKKPIAGDTRSDGSGSPSHSDRSIDGDKPKDDKKAIEYMKEQYEGEKDKSAVKIIRKPKKLTQSWKEADNAAPEESPKDFKPLPKEQDLLAYTSVGLEYTKNKYVEKVEEAKERAELDQLPVPRKEGSADRSGPPIVNRCEPEKVAPPQITRNVLSMFETGKFADLHTPKKINPREELPAEGGVFENEPVVREDLIRQDSEVEKIEMDTGRLKKSGVTKNLLSKWEVPKDEPKKPVKGGGKKKDMVKVAEDEGRVAENDPKARDNVVRGDDTNPSEVLPGKGSAKKAKAKLTTKKEKPKEKQEYPLMEKEGVTTVFENEPEDRGDMAHYDDEHEQIEFERGKIKNLTGFFLAQTDDVKVEKKKIIIERDAEPTVLENEPERRDGVIRSDDISEADKSITFEAGRIKNMASFFKSVQDVEEDEHSKKPKKPVKLELAKGSSTVVENQPEIRPDVVRHDDSQEDVIVTGPGHTKNIASRFLKQDDDHDKKPRDMIRIERSHGPCVIENEPEESQADIVRAEDPGQQVVLETGRTKNLLQHWIATEEDASKPKTSTHAVEEGSKPRWIMEIEAARQDKGVYENEPESPDEDIVRADEDYNTPVVPEKHTMGMRDMWTKKQLEEEERELRKRTPELVRFTPPREKTPPPGVETAQKEEYQRVTLSQPYEEDQPRRRKKKASQQQKQGQPAVQQQQRQQVDPGAQAQAHGGHPNAQVSHPQPNQPSHPQPHGGQPQQPRSRGQQQQMRGQQQRPQQQQQQQRGRGQQPPVHMPPQGQPSAGQPSSEPPKTPVSSRATVVLLKK